MQYGIKMRMRMRANLVWILVECGVDYSRSRIYFNSTSCDIICVHLKKSAMLSDYRAGRANQKCESAFRDASVGCWTYASTYEVYCAYSTIWETMLHNNNYAIRLMRLTHIISCAGAKFRGSKKITAHGLTSDLWISLSIEIEICNCSLPIMHIYLWRDNHTHK